MLVEEVFYIYLLKDNADIDDWHFWKDPKLNVIQQSKPLNSAIIRRFYNINWDSDTSLVNFINNIKKEPQRGGSSLVHVNANFSPKTIVPLLEEQEGWEEMNDAYNNLNEEQKLLFEEPESEPINTVVEVFNSYTDKTADQEALEEARNTVGLLTPEEADEAMETDTDSFDKVVSAYSNAFKAINPSWVPIMARADMLRVLTGST
jgi:hypothetical protein